MDRHSQSDQVNRGEDSVCEKSRPQVQVSPETQNSETLSINSLHGRRRKHFILSWWQEVAACVVAIAAFFALFATLYAYAGKTIPHLPSGISLNAILSLYTKVLEAAVVLIVAEGLGQLKWVWLSDDGEKPLGILVNYDNAIHGSARSALALIYKLRLSHLLSSAGAVIVILVLAIDPLTQQIVEYYDCEAPTTGGKAIMPRTNYYMPPVALHSTGNGVTIDISIQRRIYTALYSPDLDPAVTCLGGNCTWSKEYSTVGFCQSCQDIASELVITNTSYINGNGQDTLNITTASPYVNVSMASDLEAKPLAAMGPSNVASPAGTSPGPLGEAATLDFILGQNVRGRQDPATQTDWTDCDNSPASGTWRCRGYGASRCSLYPCVKTYNAFVKSGKLTETLKGTTSSWGMSSNLINNALSAVAMLDSECINPDERRSLTDLGYVLDGSTRWLAYNMTESPYDGPRGVFPHSMITRNCVYMMDTKFVMSIKGFLENFFTGNVVGHPSTEFSSFGQYDGPQVIQAIYNFGNVSFDRVNEFMSNISIALSNEVRQTKSANFSEPAAGEVEAHQTCIAVKWPYLAFPATLTVFTVVFFVLMLIKTRPTGHRPEIWKSSTLPLLYQSLGQGEGDSDTGADRRVAMKDLQEMQTHAKTRKVTFKELMRNAAKDVVQEVVDGIREV